MVHRVTRHLVSLFFVLALVCYLDRANLAFAGSQLREDLHFSASTYGVGAGQPSLQPSQNELFAEDAICCRHIFSWICSLPDTKQPHTGQSWGPIVAIMHAGSVVGCACCLFTMNACKRDYFASLVAVLTMMGVTALEQGCVLTLRHMLTMAGWS